MKTKTIIALVVALSTVAAHAALIGEYTFNDIGVDGQTLQERIDIALSPSSEAAGATLSGLGFNVAQTLDFLGLNNLAWPNLNDAYSFGGAGGGQVMFFHRAEAGAAGTAWGAGGSTDAGYTPLSFTLTAGAGYSISVDSITLGSQGAQGSAALWALQEENAAQGAFVQDAGAPGFTTVNLAAPVAIAAGTSKTFTISINSYVHAADTFLDNVAVNGSVIPEPATIGLMGLAGVALIGLRRLHA
ncbi:MAG: PEP-CTERM sorting domain-containing protein [Verrucomicrobiota bacterium]